MKKHFYENGATLLYEENKKDATTSVTLGFKCGSQFDGKHPGLSHFLEHMLVSDTDKLTRDEVHVQNDIMDNFQNAFTTKDCIALTFNCPSVNFVNALKLNSDFVFRTHFDEKLMKDEIRPIVEEMNVSSDEDNMNDVISLITGNTSGYVIGTKENITSAYILGTEASLNKITSQDFFDYMNKYFVAENFVIGVVSSLPFEQVEKAVEENFINKLVSKPENKVTLSPTEYEYIKEDLMVALPGALKNAQNSFTLTFFFSNAVADDFDDKKYSNFEDWLFNSETGKLTKIFREQEGLTYTSYFQTVNLNGLHLKCFNIITSPKKVHTTIKTMVNMLDDLITNGISDEELAQFYKRTCSRRDRKRMSEHHSNNMFMHFIREGNKNEKRNLFDELLHLTKEELNDYFKNTYGFSNVGIILNGDLDKAQNIASTKEIRKALKKFENAPWVVTDEAIQKMIDEKIQEFADQIKPLPTLNEVLAGFKLTNKIMASLEKSMIIPEISSLFSKENLEDSFKVSMSDVTLSPQAEHYIKTHQVEIPEELVEGK